MVGSRAEIPERNTFVHIHERLAHTTTSTGTGVTVDPCTSRSIIALGKLSPTLLYRCLYQILVLYPHTRLVCLPHLPI